MLINRYFICKIDLNLNIFIVFFDFNFKNKIKKDKKQEHHIKILNNKERSFREILNKIRFSKTMIMQLSLNKLKLSYVQTILGPLYHYLLPFIQTLIFNFLLTDIANVNLETGYPNFLFYFTGFVMWNYFASSTVMMSSVYTEYKKVIENMYTSRLVFFFVPLIFNFIPLILGLLNIFIMVNYFNVENNFLSKIIFLIPVIILTIILAISFGLIISGLSVKYRDVTKSSTIILQFLLMLSGVLYSQNQLPEYYNILTYINPFLLVTELSRWIWLSSSSLILDFNQILSQILIIVFLFIISIIVFKKADKNLADYL